MARVPGLRCGQREMCVTWAGSKQEPQPGAHRLALDLKETRAVFFLKPVFFL